ncbi:MAG: enoyl-CoA hydratase/isomerase family protein, partial [Chloroflexi bacterium]|nr:enoyl-CoA hydratase/isomerase family protein [Chloroflexota bacterium]
FCAGLDLREMQEGGWLPDFWGPLHFDIWKPVIVAINGPCVGGGMDFASECDIVIASEEAFFMDSHVSIGLVSAHEGLQMARRLPFPVALRMALVGNHERLTARRAYELGFVTEIHPREELNAAAQRIAEAILSNAPLAVRGTKELLIRGQHQSLSEAMILAERIRRDNTRTEDIREGPRAFVEKRKPVWKAK